MIIPKFFHTIPGVMARRISSDALSLSLLLDAVEKHGPLSILERSGFKRIRRLN